MRSAIDALRTKAEIDVEHLEETSNEQAGADEQHARERDLGNDERATRPLPALSIGRRASRRLERVVHAGLGNLKRRRRYRTRGRRRCASSAVNAIALASTPTLREQRQADRVHVRDRARADHGEDQSDRRAARREHDALGQHLPNEAAAARAERRANGHLLLSSRGAREQQVRQVRADDEHDDADGRTRAR